METTKVLGVIPYYGEKDQKLDWLSDTIASMKLFSDVIVFVNNIKDFEDVKPIHSNIIKLECKPLFLPNTLCKYLQNNKLLENYKYVFYNEADQIVKFTNLPFLLSNCNIHSYIVPNRLEEFKSNFSKIPSKYLPLYWFSNIIKIEGVSYIMPNRIFNYSTDDYFYINHHHVLAYGGAFLCSKQYFNDIDFKEPNNLHLENPSFCAYFNGAALKTVMPEDFCVIHLSAEKWLN